MTLTKEEQKMYPKTMTVRYFKFDSDTRDSRNERYATETVVKNRLEENRWAEMLNHDATIVVEVKLPNGVIK